MRFSGTLCVLDEPSDRAPSGARGKRVVLTISAAQEALPGLIGAPVTACAALDKHIGADRIGIVERAWIDGCQLLVEGTLHSRPDAIAEAVPDTLGMSYEMENAHVENLRAGVWRMTKTTFTAATVVLRDKAAYRKTRFEICQ